MEQVGGTIRRKLSTLIVILLIGCLVTNGIVFAASKKEVRFRDERKVLSIGQSYRPKIMNSPKNATFKWKTSNKKVVKVSKKGKIKAIKQGSVSISCTMKARKKIQTIKMEVQVKEPSIEKTSRTLIKGERVSIAIRNAPKEAKYLWKSSDKSIATVSSKGKVTAKKVGKVKIRVTITWIKGKKTKKKTITYNLVVKNKKKEEELPDTSSKPEPTMVPVEPTKAPGKVQNKYTYDALGRVIRIKYGDGTKVNYKYDKNGNIIKVVKE